MLPWSEQVEKCVDFGSTITNSGNFDYERAHRANRLSCIFQSAERQLCSRHDVHLHPNVAVYKPIVLAALLYGAWAMITRARIDRLRALHATNIAGQEPFFG